MENYFLLVFNSSYEREIVSNEELKVWAKDEISKDQIRIKITLGDLFVFGGLHWQSGAPLVRCKGIWELFISLLTISLRRAPTYDAFTEESLGVLHALSLYFLLVLGMQLTPNIKGIWKVVNEQKKNKKRNSSLTNYLPCDAFSK